MTHDPNEATGIPGIIGEFSQAFAFARVRWARYAEEIHADLSGVDMMTLQVIQRKGPLTATQLRQLQHTDKAVVSRQLSKLRRLGLVVAEPSAEDRRAALLTTTPEARERLHELHRRIAEDYRRRFAEWSEEDLGLLRELLRRFNASG
ncbi:MarR family transcriptional regulator [Leucobacter weissii]|uniref:MarR family transcriptional regulator n=1 Tax=Leucobacter weissii TaxID=1983706 RepID=A0A939MIB9_9MICO|nr:MarR family transcriptional regulator [Leucobacter weissii]MBO1900555.1 MarR family transcriptional regulator [Leucobacter weissii]